MAPGKLEVCQGSCVSRERLERAEAHLQGRDPEAMAELFKLLSSPARLRILMGLEAGELCVCELAALVGLSMPATSQHLKQLRQMGLVTLTNQGKMAFYSLGPGVSVVELEALCARILRASLEEAGP